MQAIISFLRRLFRREQAKPIDDQPIDVPPPRNPAIAKFFLTPADLDMPPLPRSWAPPKSLMEDAFKDAMASLMIEKIHHQNRLEWERRHVFDLPAVWKRGDDE